MSFFYYDVRGKQTLLFFILFYVFFKLVPDDVFTPRVHLQEELDAVKVPLDRRDKCKDYYAEFKKCILV